MHLRDPLFYERGSLKGIYAHFRSGAPICATIQSPRAPKTHPTPSPARTLRNEQYLMAIIDTGCSPSRLRHNVRCSRQGVLEARFARSLFDALQLNLGGPCRHRLRGGSNTMRRLILAVLGSLVVLACKPSVPPVRSAERAVLRALLDSSYGNDSLRGVLVRERFAAFPLDVNWERWLRDNIPDLPASVIDEFKRVATDSSALGTIEIGRGRLQIIPDTVLRNLFRPGPGPDRWQVFRARYPDASTGIISLTRVGLSSDTHWAITYIDSQGDWLGGAGFLVVLRQADGVWRPVKKAILRVS